MKAGIRTVPLSIWTEVDLLEKSLLAVLSSLPTPFQEPALILAEAGGKRLRPMLLLLTAKFGKSSFKQLESALVSVELVHLASLIHDDILDAAPVRRGVATINSKYGADFAFQVGNYLFGLAFNLLSVYKMEIIKPLAEAASFLSFGEWEQKQKLRDKNQTISNYLKRIYAKTAALFVAACQMGARLAQLSSHDEKVISLFAKNLGLAFQIYDDILDIVGNEAELGKPVGSDIYEGTVSLPMILALQEDKTSPLAAALDQPDEIAVSQAVSYLKQHQAIIKARQMAEKFAKAAYLFLEKLPSCPPKEDLATLGKFVINRYY